MTTAARTTFLLFACATIFSACRRAEPPVEAPPGTFPATEISGTLTNWPGGEAFVTLTGGYSVSSTEDPDVDEVELSPPLYRGLISAEGTFQVELSAPDPATLMPLGCTASEPEIAFLGSAVASSVPVPETSGDVLGIYGVGDPETLGRRGVWLYAEAAYQATTTCTAAAQTGLSSVNLTLAPGWNEVILSFTETGTVLTTGALPDTFIWAEFF